MMEPDTPPMIDGADPLPPAGGGSAQDQREQDRFTDDESMENEWFWKGWSAGLSLGVWLGAGVGWIIRKWGRLRG